MENDREDARRELGSHAERVMRAKSCLRSDRPLFTIDAFSFARSFPQYVSAPCWPFCLRTNKLRRCTAVVEIRIEVKQGDPSLDCYLRSLRLLLQRPVGRVTPQCLRCESIVVNLTNRPPQTPKVGQCQELVDERRYGANKMWIGHETRCCRVATDQILDFRPSSIRVRDDADTRLREGQLRESNASLAASNVVLPLPGAA